jgi:hypothetical protein
MADRLVRQRQNKSESTHGYVVGFTDTWVHKLKEAYRVPEQHAQKGLGVREELTLCIAYRGGGGGVRMLSSCLSLSPTP